MRLSCSIAWSSTRSSPRILPRHAAKPLKEDPSHLGASFRASAPGGSDLVENERHLLQEIDALVRTSPIAIKKPTPVEEADTIIDIFDNTLFETVPRIYRRFDDWILGERAGRVTPVCPAFSIRAAGLDRTETAILM